MKFCSNCGTQLEDDAVFCTNCGTKQEELKQDNKEEVNNASQTVDSTVNGAEASNNQKANNGFAGFIDKLKNDKKTRSICIGAMAAVIVLICILVGVNNAHHTVDLTKYYHVTFEGADTKGHAYVDVDENGLYDALTEAGGKKMKNNDGLFSPQFTIEATISTEITPNEDLSNGDKVTLHISYSEAVAKEYGVKLKAKDKKFKVEGLKDVEEFNPFDYIEISYEGVEPNIRASFNVSKDAPKEIQQAISFTSDKSYNLSVGDKYTVEVIYSENSLLEQGYTCSETEKEFTVDGGDTYVSSADDIDEKALKAMDSEAKDAWTAYTASYEYTFGEKQYLGYYLLNSKDKTGNTIYMVHQCTVSDPDGKFADTPVYLVTSFQDVVKKSDGTVEYSSRPSVQGSTSVIELSDGGKKNVLGITDGAEVYKNFVTAYVDRYTYTVVGDALKAFGE